ncbi:hypothetical protein TH53_13670 [Pedobacter lusitanus]|uniref:Inclusion body protein n=1 Tax=Pedobacter lusitanus TaxID=1503925 RepID=A0A0D0GHG5_9SPHI|nr:inclusion body family protein [Pedobacter lusitanus]KIO76717.1 hypothetical protein TH53_13670 [Pedobacter lusitanus]
MSKLKSSATIIDVLVVIDTDYVKSHYARNDRQSNPFPIDHLSEYVIATGANGTRGQGTADITFSAAPNDRVCFRGVSAYNNSDDAVIVYGIKPYGSDQPDLFNTFNYDKVIRSGAVVPNEKIPNGLPAIPTRVSFYSYNSTVREQGSELYVIQFALYELDSTGEKQQIYGYFQWDPTIIIT